MATENVLATQITLGTIGAGLLAYLKTAKWAPWFNKHSAKINHAWLALTSISASLGIHAVWDSANHSLLITGLSLVAIVHFAWECIKQWCVQYAIQRGVFGPVSVPGDAPPAPAVMLKEAEAKP